MTIVDDRGSRPLGPCRWIAVGVVIVMVILSFVQARKRDAQLADFGAYYRAGQYVAAGGTPYQLDKKYRELGAYMYCPAFAYVACRPLAALPYPWAVRAFMVVNWGATVGVVWLALRLVSQIGAGPSSARGNAEEPQLRRVRAEDGPAPSTEPSRGLFWVGATACASVGMYLWSDIHNGQVGTLLLLCCLGWLSLTLAGRPILGGMLLALAVGMKIYPLLLLPYLLLRRQWWPGFVGVVIGLAMLFVTPTFFVGSHGLLPLHREWLKFCIDTQLPMQTYRAGNESLLGVLARTPGISDGWHLFSQDHLATLVHVYPLIVVAITAGLYGWIALRRTRDPLADMAVLLIWMTLASPRAWTFNLAAELPAAMVLAAVVIDRRPGWPLAIVGLVAPIYAVSFPTNPPLLPMPTRWTFGTQFLYDKHFVAGVVLATITALFGEAGVRSSSSART